MHENRVYYLLKRYYSNLLSEEERRELHILVIHTDLDNLHEDFIQLMQQESISLQDQPLHEKEFESNLQEILMLDRLQSGNEVSVTKDVKKQRTTTLRWMAVAASILLCIALPFYFYKTKMYDAKPTQDEFAVHDLHPGTDGGILDLGNGKKLNLDNLPDGKTEVDNIQNVEIKINRQNAVYSIVQAFPIQQLIYQEIETPKGKRYKVKLSDGTMIWLNSGSKLKYPIQFAGDKREVYLSGEAYFEVVHNSKKPFYVKLNNNNSAVEVLGTTFNIRNYPEDLGFYTSLINGKVNIKHGDKQTMLKPGEVVFASMDGSLKRLQKADTEGHIAWKNDFFYFDNADLKTVMTELGRWYDFQVEYPSHMPTETYSGKIGKDLTLSQVLNILAGTNLKYELKSKKRLKIIE